MAISRKHSWPAQGAGAAHALRRALAIATARSERSEGCPICSVWRYRGNILARVGSAARSLNQNGAVLADVERVIPCRGQSGTSSDTRVRLPRNGPVGGRGDGPFAGAVCALLE